MRTCKGTVQCIPLVTVTGDSAPPVDNCLLGSQAKGPYEPQGAGVPPQPGTDPYSLSKDTLPESIDL
jgi:hypothetical protein